MRGFKLIWKGKGRKSGENKDSAAAEIREPNMQTRNPADSMKTQIPPETMDPKAVTRVRRRLSVGGDDVNLDGIEDERVVGNADVVPLPEKENVDNFFSGSYFGKSQKGYAPYNPRKVNQDYMMMKDDSKTKSIILGAFDGHGEHGHCISEFICNSFYRHLIRHEQWMTDMKVAAVEALQQAEQECNRSRFIKSDFSGTTAVIVIIRGQTMVVLNVGDSRAIMASEIGEDCVITELTHDHKPTLPEEKERIEQAGGRVFAMAYDDGYDGPARVWLKDQDIPGLAMSRSLCDKVAHSVGVISTPEVTERVLTEDDRVIVIGSDGLWEFIPSDEVIQLIEDCENPTDAVDRLCTISWKRWFDVEKVVDDTTILVVFLGMPV